VTGRIHPEGAPRPSRDARARALASRAGRFIATSSYLRKWIVLGVVIGAIAGVGAVVFFEALKLCTHFFLGVLAGYHVPAARGEGGGSVSARPSRPWALPLVVGAGALLGALLVQRFAPEAEGHGTDAAIAAVHENPRGVRFRAVVVKIVASALTIGSGGSGGREGPTGQISAGFGSLLARVLELEPEDGRIALATGIGSGIGAIFGAPLGGAVLACEILYRDDIDTTALLPCFIASVVSYTIFGGVEGYGPLFGQVGSYHFAHPVQLAWFALIGVLGGLIGLAYAKGFYGLADLFGRSPLPRWANPALAGVAVGLLGIAMPQVLGTGYGFVQQALGPGLLRIPLWVVLLLPLAKILATGLSIGSGGSGGIFGPGLVIGAFVGAAVWRVFEPVAPSLGHDPAPFVIVGMMCCFGSISRAPLAVMLMVAEMTGSLAILAPAMIAVGLAWLLVRRGDDTIYRSQLRSRAEAPAQRLLAGLPLLSAILTQRAMAPPRVVLEGGTSPAKAAQLLSLAGVAAAPVVDQAGRYEGTVRAVDLHQERTVTVAEAADAGAPTVPRGGRLAGALESLATAPAGFVAVVDDDRRVVGTLAVSDVVAAYRHHLMAGAQRLGSLTAGSGAFEVMVEPGSPAAGRALRHAGLPPGVLITAVARGDELLIPEGGTVLRPGDRLSVLGQRPAIETLGRVSTPED
jgi:H+/Cl- antiporter ClcA/CBS domain-containing protein